jgi:hypothetical protein
MRARSAAGLPGAPRLNGTRAITLPSIPLRFLWETASFQRELRRAIRLITIAMSAVIGAETDRVWRALTEPLELVSWDDRLVAPIEAPLQYPFHGQHVRWRYRLGSVQLVLHERPQAVVPGQRLRSILSLGSMRFDQTYTLLAESSHNGDPSRTRLGLKIVASNSVPVIGSIMDRFEVRRLATERIDTTLRSLSQWCEKTP